MPVSSDSGATLRLQGKSRTAFQRSRHRGHRAQASDHPHRASAALAAALVLAGRAVAQNETPLAGHYPPGQSGFRAAAYPEEGGSYTNFSRVFLNLDVIAGNGTTVGYPGKVRYANISMITWTGGYRLFGMRYGVLVGIPFSTGDLNPASNELGNTGLGLGDVLITPVSLTGTSAFLDYQFQLTVWSDSGRFQPGSADNRGSGFWSLVYSVGAVWYPTGSRDDWSVSATARIEQNFKQRLTGIKPGDDVVIDWGIGKMVRARARPIEIGVSGFAGRQLAEQVGGPSPVVRKYSTTRPSV